MGNNITKGQKIKDYTILTELGRGAFGVVHKARKDTGKFYAVKSLLNSADEQVSQKELEMAAHISRHDNIVSIYEHFSNRTPQGQEIYIVMEFCEGGDLDSYVVENKPDLMERFAFMVDMARGVNHLHTIKVCHRDLKPQNVLLTRGPDRFVCKITDFGISKVQTSTDVLFSTQCGSIPFVAPEIVDGAQYNFSVDIFSLGLLFFAVATSNVVKVGHKQTLLPATMESGRLELLNTQIRNRKIGLGAFLDKHFKFSHELGKVIFSMLNVDPEKRPAIDFVIAQVAEVKGTLKAAATPKPAPKQRQTSAGEDKGAVEDLQKQNEVLMTALMNLHRVVSQAKLNMGEEADFGSFEDDAVGGVIKVRKGIMDPEAGFTLENMGSFETDAVGGIIQVIDGRSNDSGIIVN